MYSVDVCKIFPQKKNKTTKRMFHRVLAGHTGVRRGPGGEKELTHCPKSQLAIGSRWFLSGNVRQRLPNLGILFSREAGIPDVYMESIIYQFTSKKKKSVSGQENTSVRWIWPTDCKIELGGKQGVVCALQSQGLGSNPSFTFFKAMSTTVVQLLNSSNLCELKAIIPFHSCFGD